MDVNVVLKKDNPPLSRREFVIEVTFKGATPKRDEIKNALVAKLGAQPELLVIKKADQLTGRKKVRVFAYQYSDKETLMRVEPPYILKREGFVQDEKKSEN